VYGAAAPIQAHHALASSAAAALAVVAAAARFMLVQPFNGRLRQALSSKDF